MSYYEDSPWEQDFKKKEKNVECNIPVEKNKSESVPLKNVVEILETATGVYALTEEGNLYCLNGNDAHLVTYKA